MEPSEPVEISEPGGASVALTVGEALVRQSSGRHRAQAALGVSVDIPVRGVWGVALEALGTVGSERSDQIALDQYLVRPAALVTLTFARPSEVVERLRPRPRAPVRSPYLALDVGLGPAAALTLANWESPALDPSWAVEPGVRGRAGMAFGLGAHLRVRLQGGLAWRPSGTDHDYLLGAAWAF